MPPYQIPALGTLPKRGKDIAKRLYPSLREHGYSSESASRITWTAIRKAGFHKKSYARR